GLVTLVVGQAMTGNEQTWATAVPLQLSFFLLPVCLAVAILRYRLYDVDVIINRAVIYGVSTLVVATGYVLLVVGVGELLGSQSHGFWPSVVATAVVAMAFQPLRTRVVRLADRLAYGARAAPYDALSDFSRRVGHSPAPESLLPAVAEAAGQAVSAHEVRVMLDVEHGPLPTGAWVADGAPQLAVDLDALRELTRGIFPTILTRSGLGPALSAYVARLGRSGVLDVDASVAGQRFPARTEAAAYFCCTRAVAGADSHVSLAVVGAHLQIE